MTNNTLSNDTIQITSSTGWDNYELIDSGDGQKLERYGNILLNRPEPEAFWAKSETENVWSNSHAFYTLPTQERNGSWKYLKKFQTTWPIQVDNVRCILKLSSSRHIGIFPEQYPQWIWLREHILASNRPLKVLNLFGYTGMATLFAAQAGAHVTHVDASKKAVLWAKENQAISNLQDKPIRWIVDDALKFAQREARRQNSYDVILLDPPKFGRGPNGEVWEFYKFLPNLLDACLAILSPKATFLLLTAYAVKASALTLKRSLRDKMQDRGGYISVGELVQQESSNNKYLSRAIYALWKIE